MGADSFIYPTIKRALSYKRNKSSTEVSHDIILSNIRKAKTKRKRKSSQFIDH